MFTISITAEAKEDLRALQKRDQRTIVDGIESRLRFEPDKETRNRKRLRPNELAEWEVRIAKFRVFYVVDHAQQRVRIIAVGYKSGNRLIIRNREFKL